MWAGPPHPALRPAACSARQPHRPPRSARPPRPARRPAPAGHGRPAAGPPRPGCGQILPRF